MRKIETGEIEKPSVDAQPYDAYIEWYISKTELQEAEAVESNYITMSK